MLMAVTGSSWLRLVRQLEELKQLSRMIPNQKKAIKVREKVRRLYKVGVAHLPLRLFCHELLVVQ